MSFSCGGENNVWKPAKLSQGNPWAVKRIRGTLHNQKSNPWALQARKALSKGKRKAPQCLPERRKCCEGARSNFDQSKLQSVNKSHWNFLLWLTAIKGLRNEYPGSFRKTAQPSQRVPVPSLSIWENEMHYLWAPLAGRVRPLTSIWNFLQNKWIIAHLETRENATEHAV